MSAYCISPGNVNTLRIDLMICYIEHILNDYPRWPHVRHDKYSALFPPSEVEEDSSLSDLFEC